MLQPAYTEASPAQRIEALCDAGSASQLALRGSCTLARVRVDGREVFAAATDPGQMRGALGSEETEALREMLAQARAERRPAILLLDSAGARVDEGLHALGGFRSLFAEMLEADADGLPMYALLGRWCFGGASLLAGLCARRSYLSGTLFATSGPGVIEAAEGKSCFDAADRAAVTALLGSAARRRWHPEDDTRGDSLADAARSVRRWLATPAGEAPLDAAHAALRQRVGAPAQAAQTCAAHDALSRLLPPGYRPVLAGNLFRALPAEASGKAAFLGTLGGEPVGALDCLQLSQWLLELHAAHPGSPVVLVLDAAAHAPRVADERVLLADYLVHLSRTILWLGRHGHRRVLWIPGLASGASYVAFAAPVERVSALPSASIAILPDAAAARIVGERLAQAGGMDAWIAAGVADATLDDRLQRMSSGPNPS